jgi:hypothetical protein
MMNARRSVASRFVGEVMDGVRRECSSKVKATVATMIADISAVEDASQHASQYLALCERAWLHWTRLALDAITTHTLGQVSLGVFNPPQVRDAGEAARAAVRCGLHRQLLDVAYENVAHHDWPWRLEAARQIHVSTRKALIVAAAINPGGPSTSQLYRGVSLAADALVTAIAAEFVANGPIEVRDTVEAMVRRAGDKREQVSDG